MSDEVLVKAEGVSKKFCRSLKRSLWYGVQDVANEALGRDGHHNELRKNEFWAVNDISFELKRGECLGLIGPNGAGKSTLLKMLNGLVKPDKGRITMRGRIGALIELGAGFNPILTARENIYVNGSVLGFTRKEIDRKFDAIVDFAEIGGFIDTPVQNYSSGMNVRLGFAVAAQMEPDVLLIDEVLAVGDIQFRMKCFKHVINLIGEGASIILVSHSTVDINRVCSRAFVLLKGTEVANTNVSHGISEYMRVCARTEVEAGFVVGNPDLIGLSVTTQQTAGMETSNFCTGDDLQIEIRIDCRQPIPNCRIWLAIQENLAGIVSGFSTIEDRFDINLIGGTNSFTLTVPGLPLGIGHFRISGGVYGQNPTEVFAYRESACEFSVIGPQPKSFGMGASGLVRLSHGWKQN